MTSAPSAPARTSRALVARDLLDLTRDLAAQYLDTLPHRPVRARASRETLRAAFAVSLPDDGVPAEQTIRDLAEAAEPGLIASAGPRYFGFVIGGLVPAALAADWLTSAWDQNAGLYATSPAASVVEEVAAKWLLDLLRLPPTASVGFVTGCQMANFTALASARHAVLADVGWDVEVEGLCDAPPITIVLGAEAHVTIHTSLRMLGFGTRKVEVVECDSQGRMDARALERVLARTGTPRIVCAQAGNVNSGAFDPLAEIADLTRARGGWLHVDGAFGLWASASADKQHLTRGADRADSWATDGHKWLNVPYDSGIVIVGRSDAHRGAMAVTASYLSHAASAERDSFEWTPEFSRRARGFPIYAALRSLGRNGLANLVDRCCERARAIADLLGAEPGIEILNDVVLNQVLVRFGGSDEVTRAVITGVQGDGTCWLGGTTWHGMAAMRISVSNWATSSADAEASAAAILEAYHRCS